MCSKLHGKVGRHFGIALGPTHSSRRAEISALRVDLDVVIKRPRRYDSSSQHATLVFGDVLAHGISAIFFFISRARRRSMGQKITL